MELNSKTNIGIAGALLSGIFFGAGCHKKSQSESELINGERVLVSPTTVNTHGLEAASITRNGRGEFLTSDKILAVAREVGSVDWPLVELRTSNPSVAAAWGDPYTCQQDMNGGKSYRVWVLVSPEEYGNIRVGPALQSQLSGATFDLGEVAANNKSIHSEYYYVAADRKQVFLSDELGKEVLASASAKNFIQIKRFMSQVFVSPSVINAHTVNSVGPHAKYFLTVNIPDAPVLALNLHPGSTSTLPPPPVPIINLGGVLTAVRYPSYFKIEVPADTYTRQGSFFDGTDLGPDYSLSGRLQKIAGKIIKRERVLDTNSLEVTLTDGSRYVGNYWQMRRLQEQP